MIMKLEYESGDRITPQQFRERHKNEIYSSEAPPAALLKKYGLKVVYETLPVSTVQQLIRGQRNTELAQSDWIVSKSYEAAESVPEEWALYRQALRDITAQAGFPYTVEWPTKP